MKNVSKTELNDSAIEQNRRREVSSDFPKKVIARLLMGSTGVKQCLFLSYNKDFAGILCLPAL